MSGNLCEHCVGYCCRHIALPIDTPEERSDFDDIRWYLLHEGVGVFVEDGEWYLQVATSCRHLQPDFRCGIYETRPQICRDYSTENCDYHSGDYGYEHHFLAAEQLDAYVAEFVKDKKAKSGKNAGRFATSKNNKTSENRQSGKKSKDAQNAKKRRPRLRARPTPPDARFNAGPVDHRGVTLPVLGVRP